MDSLCSKDLNSLMAFREGIFKDGVISSCTILWLVDGEVTNKVMFQGSQTPTFWFHLAWGLCAGGQHSVNFLHLVGVLVSAKQLKDMAQDIIYGPWEGTKGPWLCFMAKLLLFCLAWLLSFIFAFSHFSD